MFDTTGVYRKQISQTVCLIGKSDFPVKWQAPVYVIAERLHEADMDKVLAALSTFDELVRRYRFETKSEDLWREIIFVLQNVCLNDKCQIRRNHFVFSHKSSAGVHEKI